MTLKRKIYFFKLFINHLEWLIQFNQFHSSLFALNDQLIFSLLCIKNYLAFKARSANRIEETFQSILLFVVIHKINNKDSQKDASKNERQKRIFGWEITYKTSFLFIFLYLLFSGSQSQIFSSFCFSHIEKKRLMPPR